MFKLTYDHLCYFLDSSRGPSQNRHERTASGVRSTILLEVAL